MQVQIIGQEGEAFDGCFEVAAEIGRIVRCAIFIGKYKVVFIVVARLLLFFLLSLTMFLQQETDFFWEGDRTE